MLNWWYNFLPTIIQDQWIGVRKIENIENVYNIYKAKSNFLNPDFLDSYLPSQPNLLCALIILLLFSAITFLVFCAFFLAERFGAFRQHKNYFSSFSQNSSKKKIFDGMKKRRSFIASYIFMLLIWATLLFTSFMFVFCLIDFLPKSSGDDVINNIYEHESSTNLTNLDEENLISKFNDIRELGYEFKPLERDATNFSKYFLLMVIFGFYGICLIVSPIASIIGFREKRSIERHTNNYDYTFDFYRSSNMASRAGKTLFIVAILMFVVSPLVNLFAAVLIIHSHANTAICPFDQTVTQNVNIEEYVNANYELFESVSLVDFLGDLSHERVEINRVNCAEYIRPFQGMWACLLVLSWLSVIFVALQIRVSRYFTQKSDESWSALVAENSAAIAAGWPNYAPEADTYAAAVDAYSKYSFGTFIYQKY